MFSPCSWGGDTTSQGLTPEHWGWKGEGDSSGPSRFHLFIDGVSCVLPWARSRASDSSSCAMLRTKGGMSHFAEGETGSEGVVHSFIQFILTKPLLCVRQTDKSHVPAALVG